MRTVAIVPARGGSKGIARKNLREVAGRSLVGWAVKAGLEAKLVDEVYVSSEDADILAEAVWCGAKTIRRPVELATDEATTDSALYHAACELSWGFDLMVTLQPTVPVRRVGLVDDCIQFLIDKGADSVHTGRKEHYLWRRKLKSKHNGEVVLGPYVQINCQGRRIMRQEFTEADVIFGEDGAVFVTRASYLAARRERIAVGGYLEIFENGKLSVDIDTEVDILIAEALLTACAKMSVTTLV